MEVLVDLAGYVVSLDYKDIMYKLKDNTLEAEILQVINQKPYNKPTGKKLTLSVDPSIKKISLSYSPDDADWDNLKRIDVKISPDEYDMIYFGSGRILGTKPPLPADIMIQDSTSTRMV